MKKITEIKAELLDYFVSKGKISPAEAKKIDSETDSTKVELALVKTKKITEEEITKAKADIFNLTYIYLVDQVISREILEIFPKDLALNYKMAAFGKEDNILKVGLLDPLNIKAREAAEYIAREKGLKIEYYLISATSFRYLLQRYGDLASEVDDALKIAKDKFSFDKEKKAGEQSETLTTVIKSAPISKMVSVILKHAVESRASDIHIEPTSGETRVRYRIDGVLHTSLVLPKYIHAAVVSRIKVMSNLKIDETRIPQDGRIRVNIDGKNIDFRVSTLPLYSQEKVVMRILDTSKGVSTWQELGFEGRNLTLMQENIKKPHGMFLVTGPTGSGKSTTLYAALQLLNKEGTNIVTLEDPVEYYLDGINQSQVRPEVDYTFASGLRSILRQDPDIIMVGEIRDSETAELGIHASLTGHFVLSTLHTNDAFGAIPRLMDMHLEPFLLASTLNIVIAQRLVRTICQDCKEEVNLPGSLREKVKEIYNSIDKKNLPPELDTFDKIKHVYRGKGCNKCQYTGYRGRTAIVEVLDVNKEIKNIIYSKGNLSEIKKVFIKQGMLTLKQDGLIKALQGKTTLEEIFTATKD